MEEQAAIVKVAMERRAEAVADWRVEIARLQARIAKANADRGQRLVDRWFPLSDKRNDGTWECGAGQHIGTVTETARRLAELTGAPVYFVFNERLHAIGREEEAGQEKEAG